MTYRILRKDSLGSVIDILGGEYELHAPRRDGKASAGHVWRPVDHAGQLDFGFVNTDMSPKGFFFPQSECLLRFSTHDGQPPIFRPEPAEKPKVLLLNVRPCDAKAMAVLDAIFSRDERSDDIYWRSRRERTILAGLACNAPCPTCFCLDANCGPHHEVGLDLLCTDLGDRLLLKALTDGGQALVQMLDQARDRMPDGKLAEPEPADLERAQALKARAEAAMAATTAPNATTAPTLGRNNIDRREVLQLHELPYWERVAERCLNCGVCTYVCPTCHCFDIQDETHAFQGQEGRRVRNWDTCMSPLFTLHASGHNPRGDKAARVRQRFMHKFKYIPMKHGGEMGCVGCGRCTRQCPVNIDVRHVVNAMNA